MTNAIHMRRLQTKTPERQHLLRDIVANNSKKLLLYGTQNIIMMIWELIVK